MQRQRSLESAFVSDSGLKFIAPELTTYPAVSSSSTDDLSPAVDIYNFALLIIWVSCSSCSDTQSVTHTRLTALFSRKVKPISILLKQETVSGSGISWAICKSAPRSSLVPAPHHSVFYQLCALLPPSQHRQSNHSGGFICFPAMWLDKMTYSIQTYIRTYI